MDRATAIPDPLIDEVRARRRALFQACGGELIAFFERLKRAESERADRNTRPTQTTRPAK